MGECVNSLNLSLNVLNTVLKDLENQYRMAGDIQNKLGVSHTIVSVIQQISHLVRELDSVEENKRYEPQRMEREQLRLEEYKRRLRDAKGTGLAIETLPMLKNLWGVDIVKEHYSQVGDLIKKHEALVNSFDKEEV